MLIVLLLTLLLLICRMRKCFDSPNLIFLMAIITLIVVQQYYLLLITISISFRIHRGALVVVGSGHCNRYVSIIIVIGGCILMLRTLSSVKLMLLLL